MLKEFEGYYVVRLVECDGVPKYSHGGLYEEADETSLRGAFLNDCQDVLSKDLLNEAWNHKSPGARSPMGKHCLRQPRPLRRQVERPSDGVPFLSRLGLAKEPQAVAIAEQLDIVQAAGRWFIFWGERGHPIRAWF